MMTQEKRCNHCGAAVDAPWKSLCRRCFSRFDKSILIKEAEVREPPTCERCQISSPVFPGEKFCEYCQGLNEQEEQKQKEEQLYEDVKDIKKELSDLKQRLFSLEKHLFGEH